MRAKLINEFERGSNALSNLGIGVINKMQNEIKLLCKENNIRPKIEDFSDNKKISFGFKFYGEYLGISYLIKKPMYEVWQENYTEGKFGTLEEAIDCLQDLICNIEDD